MTTAETTCRHCGREVYFDSGGCRVHARIYAASGSPYTACGGPGAPITLQRVPLLVGRVAEPAGMSHRHI